MAFEKTITRESVDLFLFESLERYKMGDRWIALCRPLRFAASLVASLLGSYKCGGRAKVIKECFAASKG